MYIARVAFKEELDISEKKRRTNEDKEVQEKGKKSSIQVYNIDTNPTTLPQR